MGYNVAVGVLLLLNAYDDRARLNMVCMYLTCVALLADIVDLSLHGSAWNLAAHEYSFGESMMILNLFVKVLDLPSFFSASLHTQANTHAQRHTHDGLRYVVCASRFPPPLYKLALRESRQHSSIAPHSIT